MRTYYRKCPNKGVRIFNCIYWLTISEMHTVYVEWIEQKSMWKWRINNWHFAVEKKERDLKYKTDGCIKITYM